METCYGCGAEAESHPIVGVLNSGDVDPKFDKKSIIANPDGGSVFVGVPVCAACHQDPEHRDEHDLKCHFFDRSSASIARALVMAGSSSIGGAPSADAPAPKKKVRRK